MFRVKGLFLGVPDKWGRTPHLSKSLALSIEVWDLDMLPVQADMAEKSTGLCAASKT